MKHKLTISRLLLVALFLTVAPAAFASTWYVNGVSGSNTNSCKSPTTACKTIGHAISLASSGDSIMVAVATYAENLTISKSLKIIGSGASTTIVYGGSSGTVVGITSGASVILSRMTIRNGFAFAGGGIHNLGTLTINRTTISGNGASMAGGGIFNGGTLTIYNSTISGNLAEGFCFPSPRGLLCHGGLGGGIYSPGTLTINNTTISGNASTCNPLARIFLSFPSGGGISGTAVINNSTISGNRASIGFKDTFGGGISGTATLQNSIVANNSEKNCNGTMVSNGYNLSSDNTCAFNNIGDRNSTDPMLGPLQNNGGPTQTMALPLGSPAIDAGNPKGCTDGAGHLLTTDQRGQPRPNKLEDNTNTGCDMGAYERQGKD